MFAGGVRIGDSSLRYCRFIIKGKNNKVIIGDDCHLRNVTFWMEGDNNTITIGDRTSFTGNIQLAACEGTKIVIGNDCLFSHDIYVRTTDSHSILDMQNHRINQARDITIDNHVWVGMQCLILKGAKIADHCVVGARSMVSASTEKCENVILGGMPAKVLKREIDWKTEQI